eukprot:168476-Prorocentrum_lima.AAC.1
MRLTRVHPLRVFAPAPRLPARRRCSWEAALRRALGLAREGGAYLGSHLGGGACSGIPSQKTAAVNAV